MDGILALSTVKSFKEVMSPEDYTEFLKSEDSEKLRAFPEVAEFVKGEMPEQFKKKEDEDEDDEGKKKDGDEEKPEIKKALTEVEEAKVNLQAKEAALAVLKPIPAELSKAVTPEMLKGLQDEITGKFKAVTDILQKSLGTEDKIADLQKSVDDVIGIVEKIAGMPLGTKAIKAGAAANFFEKAFGGEQEDDDGKKILSVTLNKEVVLKSLEVGMNKAIEPELKKSYEDSIVRYNGGGGTIGQDVAIDLFENHGVRLTK